MFRHHFHESLSRDIARLFAKRDVGDLKIDLWNSFVDSGLLEINEHDCSAIPRILPLSYLPTIRRTCFHITEFLMKLLSLDAAAVKSIVPKTPINEYLINELGVLKYKQKRITGTLRYDMAIEGPVDPSNPPKLLEINEIGFDGVGRSSYIQETILRLFPELKKRVVCLDTALSEVKNMRRLGKRFVRFQYDSYTWEEEVIRMKAAGIGLDMRFVSPRVMRTTVDEDCTLLKRADVRLKGKRIYIGDDRVAPDAFQVAYSFELNDYKEAPDLFRMLIRSDTFQYSPFLTGIVAPKTILVVLSNKGLRREILGRKGAAALGDAILPARLLGDEPESVKRESSRCVLKRGDGMGGEHVFIGRRMLPRIRRIPARERNEWVVQKRVDLNTIDADGFLSRRRRVVADLSAYIQYDWNGSRFTNFSVGGFITRATNRGLKVNVSGGGIQVPVMFDRSR
jgi:hypothetical protein